MHRNQRCEGHAGHLGVRDRRWVDLFHRDRSDRTLMAGDELSTARNGLGTFVKENSLSLFFMAIFLAALGGQAIAGHDLFNQQALEHGGQTISLWRYLSTSDFAQAVTENWQSEYLQFASSCWPPSGSCNGAHRNEGARQGRHRIRRRSEGRRARRPRFPLLGEGRRHPHRDLLNSLIVVMAIIFVASWFAQSLNGWRVFNDGLSEHGEKLISWWSYLGCRRLLGGLAPELAIGVPGRGLLRRDRDLPPATWFSRVEAGRRRHSRLDRNEG